MDKERSINFFKFLIQTIIKYLEYVKLSQVNMFKFFRHPNMPYARAGFGLVSLRTGFASDETNILAIGGIQFNRESVY